MLQQTPQVPQMQITMNINFNQKNEKIANDPFVKIDQIMPIGMTRSQMN